MKRRPPLKPKAKKQKKRNKIISWIVVVRGDYINAAVDSPSTKAKLLEMGYKIVGYPAFENKTDAIDYVQNITGKYYKREKIG